MAKYAADFVRTASTSASVGSWVADATRPRRLKFLHLIFGCSTTPADQQLVLTVQRCTAAGTSTGVTPQPLDPADAATESDAGENHTVEPTYTASAILLNVGLHQRNTLVWYAPPGGELVTPATASNGLGFQTDTISSGTPGVVLQAIAEEQ